MKLYSTSHEFKRGTETFYRTTYHTAGKVAWEAVNREDGEPFHDRVKDGELIRELEKEFRNQFPELVNPRNTEERLAIGYTGNTLSLEKGIWAN